MNPEVQQTLAIPESHFLLIAAFLFSIGVLLVITKKNAIVVLMGVELIFNAANLNLVAFRHENLDGQMTALFIMIIAAAEAVVALALIIQVYKHFKTVDLDKISELKG